MGSNEEVAAGEVVLVTGFGPFGIHTTNASIEAVKLLPTLNLDQELGIKLIIKEIPVTYEYVQTHVPQLWATLKPKLVVHVGVSGQANELHLESQAFNTDYCSPDIAGCLPERSLCIANCSDRCLTTAIDMRAVCQKVNGSGCGVASCVSDDPGRYLCDFIYFTSLHIDRKRTAFVHVPVLDKPYSAIQLAQALKLAIAAMLEQVRSKDRASVAGP